MENCKKCRWYETRRSWLAVAGEQFSCRIFAAVGPPSLPRGCSVWERGTVMETYHTTRMFQRRGGGEQNNYE